MKGEGNLGENRPDVRWLMDWWEVTGNSYEFTQWAFPVMGFSARVICRLMDWLMDWWEVTGNAYGFTHCDFPVETDRHRTLCCVWSATRKIDWTYRGHTVFSWWLRGKIRECQLNIYTFNRCMTSYLSFLFLHVNIYMEIFGGNSDLISVKRMFSKSFSY